MIIKDFIPARDYKPLDITPQLQTLELMRFTTAVTTQLDIKFAFDQLRSENQTGYAKAMKGLADAYKQSK
jgi:hypothetical protein